MIERFMSLALSPGESLPTPYPRPTLTTTPHDVKQALLTFQLATEQPILALCVGAQYGHSKCWPPEYFAILADHYLNQGWQVWLFGAKSDEPLAQVVVEKTNYRCENLVGVTSLAQAIDLLSLAQMVVTNDSGLMHAACALDRPVVAIYGSSSPAFTPPLGERVKMVSLGLPCSPCFARECPQKHHRCMRDLLPAKVIAVLEELQ
jgi:heptosyltransferase-2